MSVLAEQKLSQKVQKKYKLDTTVFSPMNSTQLTGQISWRN